MNLEVSPSGLLVTITLPTFRNKINAAKQMFSNSPEVDPYIADQNLFKHQRVTEETGKHLKLEIPF